ncbi:MAG: RluA family pseudouridine synthase [Treponema sp.]|jgi:23S rRNA pseudouridine955/2504/2580 synthase|nr:RluA family pseudouridine synthase [Treponema sp.]
MTILSVAVDDGGRRLDRVLRKALPGIPLSRIHRLLREGRVLVDKRPRDAAFRVQAGQEIALPLTPSALGTPGTPDTPRRDDARRSYAAASPIVSRILYEGPDLLALNKEAGLPVHGPQAAGSLDSLVRAYLAPKLPPSLSFRPGPLHRLDKPTSGIVIFSVSLKGARYFSALLREGRVHKQYLALVEGRVEGPGRWEDPLLRDREQRRTLVSAGGKPARTAYTPLAWSPGSPGHGYSLLLLEPETGRGHQIRAQAAFHSHPLAGDSAYGGRPLPPQQPPSKPQPSPQPGAHAGAAYRPPFLLHAWKLRAAEQGPLPPLEAPLPDYFRIRIETLFGTRL